MKTKPKDRLMWWVGGAFAALLTAWATLFIIASKNRVAEVPLAPTQAR